MATSRSAVARTLTASALTSAMSSHSRNGTAKPIISTVTSSDKPDRRPSLASSLSLTPSPAVQAFLKDSSLKTLSTTISRTISLSLWSALLAVAAHGDPLVLRSRILEPVFGSRNPGPGSWDLRGCLALLAHSWHEFHIPYSSRRTPAESMPDHPINGHRTAGESWMSIVASQDCSPEKLAQAAHRCDALNDLLYVANDAAADMHELSFDDPAIRLIISSAVSTTFSKYDPHRDQHTTSPLWWLSDDEQNDVIAIIAAL